MTANKTLTDRGIVIGARVRYSSILGMHDGTITDIYGRKTLIVVVDGTAMRADLVVEWAS